MEVPNTRDILPVLKEGEFDRLDPWGSTPHDEFICGNTLYFPWIGHELYPNYQEINFKTWVWKFLEYSNDNSEDWVVFKTGSISMVDASTVSNTPYRSWIKIRELFNQKSRGVQFPSKLYYHPFWGEEAFMAFCAFNGYIEMDRDDGRSITAASPMDGTSVILYPIRESSHYNIYSATGLLPNFLKHSIRSDWWRRFDFKKTTVYDAIVHWLDTLYQKNQIPLDYFTV